MELPPPARKPDWQGDEAVTQVENVGVRMSLVQQVSALWSEYLDGREVAADDDFFALGGNSLIGIRILDRVSQDFGVELSVRAFYMAQTPARVAELIEQERRQPCG